MTSGKPFPLVFAAALFAIPFLAQALPEGFVYLDDIDPTIQVELRYATNKNFVGEKVDGYKTKRAIMTEAAALALKKVQDDLRTQGYSLKVFDAYRPQQAVNHFVRWGRNLNATSTKKEYYPDVPKNILFREGYIAARSGHSRGSTIDLTLVKLEEEGGKKNVEVDMGTPFDFFDRKSWPYSDFISGPQRENRLFLRAMMKKHGFIPYDREWWHFTLRNEPFPGTYFDFPVE